MKELYYDNGQYNLASHKAVYMDFEGTEQKQFTDSPDWFVAFERMHGGMEGLTISEVSYTDNQLERFQECKGFPPSAEEDVYNYVMLGVINAENPLFKMKMDEERLRELEKLEQEDLNNKEAIAELYMLMMGGY